LGGLLLGHTPVCAVEVDAYCRKVLEARQADGWLPEFPIYEDVREFDGKPWRGRVDVVAGGFPCQPWSTAGKRKGTDDPRHLWPEMARIVKEVRPRYVFAENVQLDAMREPWRDLRGLGYRVPPALCVAASDVGAPHLRKRWWLLATDADSAP
jgi:DNA (cytosine-5)-methyltransferase 1